MSTTFGVVERLMTWLMVFKGLLVTIELDKPTNPYLMMDNNDSYNISKAYKNGLPILNHLIKLNGNSIKNAINCHFFVRQNLKLLFQPRVVRRRLSTEIITD